MSEAVSYLGIAKKAGSLVTGEQDCGAAVRNGKAKLLLLASDASENARRRAEGFLVGKKTPLYALPYSKEKLSESTGGNGCSMVAFTDIGLAAVFMTALAGEYPDAGETAALLVQRSDKARKRKSEAQAHKRNLKTGKTTKSAAPGKRRKNI